MEPTQEQIDAYRRDGFLVVEDWLDAAEVERAREHFARCFAHEWETGLMPDEVNYEPGDHPAGPHAPALQRLEGRPDAGGDRARASESARFGARARPALPGLRADPGQRDLEAAAPARRCSATRTRPTSTSSSPKT